MPIQVFYKETKENAKKTWYHDQIPDAISTFGYSARDVYYALHDPQRQELIDFKLRVLSPVEGLHEIGDALAGAMTKPDDLSHQLVMIQRKDPIVPFASDLSIVDVKSDYIGKWVFRWSLDAMKQDPGANMYI